MAHFHVHIYHDNLICTHSHSPQHPATSVTTVLVFDWVDGFPSLHATPLPFGRELQPWELDLGSSIPTPSLGLRPRSSLPRLFCAPGTPASPAFSQPSFALRPPARDIEPSQSWETHQLLFLALPPLNRCQSTHPFTFHSLSIHSTPLKLQPI